MGTILGLLIIPFLIILQMVLFRRLALINGTADIVLLCVAGWSLQSRSKGYWAWGIAAGISLAFISKVPGYIPMLIFPAVVLLARLVQKTIWQTPILAMLVIISIGTIGYQFLTIISLQLSGSSISLPEGVFRVILPSTILNLLLAIPVFTVMRDLANLVYPEKMKV